MVSKDSAIRSLRLEFHNCFGIKWAAALLFALVLFVAIAPIPLSSSSEMPRAATLNKRAPVAKSVVAAYGKLPLSFEINQGQTDPRVKFLSRGSGYALFLTGNEAVLRLRKGGSISNARESAKSQLGSGQATPITYSVVRMNLTGASPSAKVSGLGELPGKSNYFIGNDPKNWRTNLRNYAKVKYSNVYPGVDLVYYGNQQELEYDFVLQPGADVRQLALSFDGAKRLRLTADGDLIVSMGGGELVEHKPVIYQDLNGRRRQVVGGYVLKNDYAVGFKLAAYDNRRSLTIDPSLAYSTYLGGRGGDQGLGIAVDLAGNAYVTGRTTSTNFPVTRRAFQTTLRGPENVFVSKLNPNGSALVYSTYLGGRSGDDVGNGITLDSVGNAYVTGQTSSTDFPVTPRAFQTTLGGFQNVFVSKLNRNGSALIYSTYLGGLGKDYGNGIALDSAGNAYVTGRTTSTFPVTPGAFQTTLGGGFGDAFVSKLNRNGSALVYSTYLGGSSGEAAAAVALDSTGNAYVAGYTSSSNFPVTPGAFQTTFGGGSFDAFVSKLNPNGSALVYSTYIGGTKNDFGDGIALDSTGNAYVVGVVNSNDFPVTPGAFQTTLDGTANVFVSKLNPSGSALAYSTYLGGTDTDIGNWIALDSAGNAYITGTTNSNDFPVTPGAFQPTFGGGTGFTTDAFVSKLNRNGSALVYSTYLGGRNFDYGHVIALDAAGDAYVVGSTSSTRFPVTPEAFQTKFGGTFNAFDAFVSKFQFSHRPLQF